MISSTMKIPRFRCSIHPHRSNCWRVVMCVVQPVVVVRQYHHGIVGPYQHRPTLTNHNSNSNNSNNNKSCTIAAATAATIPFPSSPQPQLSVFSTFNSLRNHHFSTYTTPTSSSTFPSSTSKSSTSSIGTDDEYDPSSMPPQYPLPIRTPPPHVMVPPAPTKHSNNNNNNNDDEHTPSSSSSSSFMEQIQHFIKKQISIPYQQNIIIQSETLFQAAMQHSNLPYVV